MDPLQAYIKEDVENRTTLTARIQSAPCHITRAHAIGKLYDHAFYKGLLIGLGVALLIYLFLPGGFFIGDGNYGQP
jgi:hypothetical protein